MHKIKLEFGCYKKGYCDGHEREDVIEAHKEYIKTWKSLENRMHLWFQDQTQKWCHVDEFKLKGENSLDRNSLGPFGGNCKIGTEWADNPSDRPLLVIANDESTFKSKKKNPKRWKGVKQDLLNSKDLGSGRMISGFAHEFKGFISLTEDELKSCNEARRKRGAAPMENKHFCVKAFDYGANRDGYWVTDDMIDHCEEVMDGLDAKFGEGRFQYCFLFDHSANHEAFAEDALHATVINKGWGGKQPKLRTTEFQVHQAVLPSDICRHPSNRVLSVGATVKVKGWWSKARAKWKQGVVTKVNNDVTEWNNGTYVVTFDEPIEQPLCFPADSPAPVSKWGGRKGPRPSTHVGESKGAHQILWERGHAPAVLPTRKRITSNNTYKRAVLKFLEDEGRVAARHHQDYCAVCSTYDEETNVTTCPPGALLDCTYCNHSRHVHRCARLPKHVVTTFDKSGKVPGVWACPECIEYARRELGLQAPQINTTTADDSSDESSDDVDDGDGIVMVDAPDETTEMDLTAVDGVLFGEWSISHMRMMLCGLPDFKAQKSRIHELIEARGHICLFLPKFHCELNWIELYWCLCKWHTRGRSEMTWAGLKVAIWQALGVVEYDNPTDKALPTSSIVRQRESRRTREYLRAYDSGACVSNVDEIRAQIKSLRKPYAQHRTPPQRGARESTHTPRVYKCSKCGLGGHNRKGCELFWSTRT